MVNGSQMNSPLHTSLTRMEEDLPALPSLAATHPTHLPNQHPPPSVPNIFINSLQFVVLGIEHTIKQGRHELHFMKITLQDISPFSDLETEFQKKHSCVLL